MTDTTVIGLAAGAASLGVVHALIGPDHYLPFVMIARARNWSLARTNMLTFVCGLGHVLSSVVLGFVGIAVVALMEKIEWLEGARGSLAAWMVIAFGLLTFVGDVPFWRVGSTPPTLCAEMERIVTHIPHPLEQVGADKIGHTWHPMQGRQLTPLWWAAENYRAWLGGPDDGRKDAV